MKFSVSALISSVKFCEYRPKESEEEEEGEHNNIRNKTWKRRKRDFMPCHMFMQNNESIRFKVVSWPQPFHHFHSHKDGKVYGDDDNDSAMRVRWRWRESKFMQSVCAKVNFRGTHITMCECCWTVIVFIENSSSDSITRKVDENVLFNLLWD